MCVLFVLYCNVDVFIIVPLGIVKTEIVFTKFMLCYLNVNGKVQDIQIYLFFSLQIVVLVNLVYLSEKIGKLISKIRIKYANINNDIQHF